MRKIFWIIPALWLVPGPLLAEPVDLGQAVRQAVSERPMTQAARFDAEAAQAAVGEARSHYLPRLTLSENLLWTDEPGGSLFISLNQEDLVLSQDADRYNLPPSRKDFETRLTLDQPLYDPDIAYGLRRAEAGAAAAEAGARRSAESAAFAAFRAYLDVQRGQSAQGWAESSSREAAEIHRLAGERQRAGVGLKADTLRAGVQVAEAERRQVALDNDLAIARRALALAMGKEGESADIAGPLTPEQFAEIPPGTLQRGDLEALALQAKEAELAREQSRAAWLPKAALSASYALHDGDVPFGSEADAWTVRAGLSWELFDGFSRSHGTARATAAQSAAEARRLEAARQARFEVEQARLRAEEARRSRKAALLGLAQAEESQRLLLQRYEAGLADLAELLSAQSSLDKARFDAVNAEAMLILALGNIRYQSGTFLNNLLHPEENNP
ncbi:RND transporter [Desulfuromonas versatilis]|uniref:RND transporter n=1 Tax=Desulfuromonas versatilis TaxID=2802975 RepID=A0ABM8HM20_9BACT|nr:TolC family protein [Desulfuromonas versatilis]BCR03266.1 RND transporter [Desulfuromonas versatilis]